MKLGDWTYMAHGAGHGDKEESKTSQIKCLFKKNHLEFTWQQQLATFSFHTF